METLWLVIYILMEASHWFNSTALLLDIIDMYFKQKQSPKSEWLQKDD
jgi:hypothetical protein